MKLIGCGKKIINDEQLSFIVSIWSYQVGDNNKSLWKKFVSNYDADTNNLKSCLILLSIFRIKSIVIPNNIDFNLL